jgi:predicted DNA-binding protein (UPF0251 family)
MSLSMNISSLENRRINYPPATSQEFLSLNEYVQISKRVISFYCKKNKGLVRRLLSSDDAISSIAENLMMGDWRWKPTYEKKIYDKDGNFLGTKTLEISRHSYRNKCAVWAIKTYLEQSSNKKNQRLDSLDFRGGDSYGLNSDMYNVIEDKNAPPVDQFFDDTVKRKVSFLLNNSKLSEAQRASVQLYFLEGLTFEEAGVKLGITKQGVQQNVEKALSNMRFTAGLKED